MGVDLQILVVCVSIWMLLLRRIASNQDQRQCYAFVFQRHYFTLPPLTRVVPGWWWTLSPLKYLFDLFRHFSLYEIMLFSDFDGGCLLVSICHLLTQTWFPRTWKRLRMEFYNLRFEAYPLTRAFPAQRWLYGTDECRVAWTHFFYYGQVRECLQMIVLFYFF